MDDAASAKERLHALESEVHVWLQRTDGPLASDRSAALRALLDASEAGRHQRLIGASDRDSFLVAHALLRRVLSRYTGIAPRSWSFSANRWGRPEISAPASASPLRFSLSHTTGLVGCAVALGGECGLDIEALGRRSDPLRVAPRVLAAPELADLQAQPAPARRERFLAYWTLKEATLKARGVGLRLPLREIAFSLHGPEIRVDFRGSAAGWAGRWQFISLRPGNEHVLALALEDGGGPPRSVRLREGSALAD